MYQLAVIPRDYPHRGIAQAHGASCNGIEHRLCVGRRLADDAQNLACRSLLLESFGELTLPILQLFGRCFFTLQTLRELLAQFRIGLGLFSHRRFHLQTLFRLPGLAAFFGGNCHKTKKTETELLIAGETGVIGIRYGVNLPPAAELTFTSDGFASSTKEHRGEIGSPEVNCTPHAPMKRLNTAHRAPSRHSRAVTGYSLEHPRPHAERHNCISNPATGESQRPFRPFD